MDEESKRLEPGMRVGKPTGEGYRMGTIVTHPCQFDEDWTIIVDFDDGSRESSLVVNLVIQEVK